MIVAFFAGLLAWPVLVKSEVSGDRPNVVIILADDQGWGDLSLHGNKDIATPSIDSLARDGAMLDRFYVCAVCAPTRAEFLTGRYHPRGGVRGVTRGAERLNLDERTVAEAFQAGGYATGCFGKWHNGMQYPYHPRARGFDMFVGFCSGHWGDYFDAELERDGVYEKSEDYITDVFTDEAIGFIEKNKDKPFFCYVPLCTPHSPMQVPDPYWERHQNKTFMMQHKQANDHTRAALAMVENIDDNVGRLLRKLEELGLDDNTIVIYFSDNGPNGSRWNGGMRGKKGSTDEGGVRVPMLIRWPAKIAPGLKSGAISGAIDLLPTLIELAGIERLGKKPLDGRSLKPILLDELDNRPDRMLFSHQNGRVSVRTPRFRLDDKGRLYEMEKDPGQGKDVAAQFPGEAEALRDAVARWREEVGLNEKAKARPFTVGHADWPMTEMPARDATFTGTIKRSSIHPNCSYLLNWTSVDDRVTWEVEVLEAGRYEAVVYYACPAGDVGAVLALTIGEASVESRVTQPHDPPIQGEAENRVPKGESFVKDFKPLSLGMIELPAGEADLTLRAKFIPGDQAIEFRRLILRRVQAVPDGE